MRMWLSSSFNKLTTREILSSRYIPERGASLRFACSKVIPRCDTPSPLCMQRCHFNEGSELNILPVSGKSHTHLAPTKAQDIILLFYVLK